MTSLPVRLSDFPYSPSTPLPIPSTSGSMLIDAKSWAQISCDNKCQGLMSAERRSQFFRLYPVSQLSLCCKLSGILMGFLGFQSEKC